MRPRAISHLRILGGDARGRALEIPPGGAARPPLVLIRKSLFDRIGDLTGGRVLDLCAGSGCLGIEALSRGAALARFVEADRAICEVIRRNLARAGVAARGEVVPARIEDPPAVPRSGVSWDEVFFDPPFAWCGSTEGRKIISDALLRTAEEGVLAAGGRVWLRVERRSDLRPEIPGLLLCDERAYGDSLVLQYEGGAA